MPGRFIFQNKNTMQWDFPYARTAESSATVTVNLKDVTDAFTEINHNCKTQLEQLRETKAQKHVKALNQLISDM